MGAWTGVPPWPQACKGLQKKKTTKNKAIIVSKQNPSQTGTQSDSSANSLCLSPVKKTNQKKKREGRVRWEKKNKTPLPKRRERIEG
jgi:hypothetical protein